MRTSPHRVRPRDRVGLEGALLCRGRRGIAGHRGAGTLLRSDDRSREQGKGEGKVVQAAGGTKHGVTRSGSRDESNRGRAKAGRDDDDFAQSGAVRRVA
jgi:hypothetical protein